MENLTIYCPSHRATTAQIVHVIDTDPETGDVKVEVIGRTDGSRRSIGTTRWMKEASLRQNYAPREYVREDYVDGPVDLSTAIELYGSRYFPVAEDAPAHEEPAKTPDLFSLIETQSQRIDEIGTVNTDILKELRQIRQILGEFLEVLKPEELSEVVELECFEDSEDDDKQGLSNAKAPLDYMRPESTDELTAGREISTPIPAH